MTQRVFERPAPGLSASTGKSANSLGAASEGPYEGDTLAPSLFGSRDVKSKSRNESMAVTVYTASGGIEEDGACTEQE